MNRQKNLYFLLSGLGLLALILDSRTAMEGAAGGIFLCIRTVIPSLFPFLFFCSLLVSSLWGGRLAWLRPAGMLVGIPRGADSLLLAALLGGYPSGAQVIADSFRENRLTREDAACLLRFCSNAGPAFLFGFLSGAFPSRKMLLALWAIQILSALAVGILGPRCPSGSACLPDRPLSAARVMVQTIRTMGLICGWILLFRILSGFLNRWFLWRFPALVQTVIAGLLELSNGCLLLSGIGPVGIRFVVCSGFLSFGGLCVLMQTASVIAPLPLAPYILGKLMQTALSLVLSVLYLRFGWSILTLLFLFLPAFPLLVKKRSGFPSLSGV